jgi:hypothetical protein
MSKFRGKGKGKPKPLTDEQVRRAAVARLSALLEQCTDTKEACRLSAAIARLTTKPRPKGTQPSSQKGRRDADAQRVLQDRIDARREELSAYAERRNAALPLPAEAPAQCAPLSASVPLRDTPEFTPELTALPPPVQRPVQPSLQPFLQPVPSAQPSAAALRQARTDRPNQDEMANYHSIQVHKPQPVAPPPSPSLVAPLATAQPPAQPPKPVPPMPPLLLVSTPCSLEEFERLRQMSADIDPGAERDRNADRLKAVEKAEIEAEAVAEFQKKQKQEWRDQLNRPRIGSPGYRGGLPKADYDVPEGRVCKTDQPEHRDGYFIEVVKETNEAAHNLTLKNF